jgi:hypothetical protein
MRLLFRTTNPTALKNNIIRLIEDGELKTWTIFEESGEKYLRHTGQWGDKGVIKLATDNVNKTLLIIQVLEFETETEDIENIEDFEGYYLGRFCELMFVYFPDRFTTIDKQ